MNGDRQLVEAPDAPAAIGPHSHAVRPGSLLFRSRMLPIDPGSGEIVDASIAVEADRCLLNLDAVCSASGTQLSRTVRATIFTTSLELFAEINSAYGDLFSSSPPERAAVAVVALPKGARVEVDAVVAVG